MKFFLPLLIVFYTTFFAEDRWRRVDCVPAEISVKHPELSQEDLTEAKALVDYAMSFYRPPDLHERPDEEKLNYLDQCAEKILGILKLYPESENALKNFLQIRQLPEFREKGLKELDNLRKSAPNSRNIQSAYLSTLLMAGKTDEARQILNELLEKFPNDPLIIMQAAVIYTEGGDYDALEKTFELMFNTPELQKKPAMQILYLRYLHESGDLETAMEYCDELTNDEKFFAEPEFIKDFAWHHLAKVDAWHELTGIMGVALWQNFWNINNEIRGELCQKTLLAAIRSNDYQSISYILKFIAELEDRALRFRLASQLGDLTNKYTSELAEKYPDGVTDNLIMLNQALGELCLKNLPKGAPPDTACRILVKYYLWGGNIQRALDLLRMIQQPTQEESNKLTDLLVHSELYEEALPRLRKLQEELAGKLTAEFYMQLGIAEDKCGNPEESKKAFYKALEINPKYASAANYLGYTLLINDGDLAEIERLLEIAINEDPNNAAIIDSVAWLRFKQGRSNEALRLMASALKIIGPQHLFETENVEFKEHLQAILASLGYDYLANFYK